MQNVSLFSNRNEAGAWRAALWAWAIGGFAAILLWPASRGSDPWFGWLPFWFVVAPLIDLVLLDRLRLLAMSRAFLVRARRRRRPLRQASRSRHGTRHLRKVRPRTAAF
jgi:hypothetical protein